MHCVTALSSSVIPWFCTRKPLFLPNLPKTSKLYDNPYLAAAGNKNRAAAGNKKKVNIHIFYLLQN